jgi:polar amino acid transport system permease protein
MVQLDFGAVLVDAPLLLRGAAMTLGLTAVSTVLGLALGIACGWARAWGPRAAAGLVAGYVELVRNTPFIVSCSSCSSGCPAWA